MKILNRNRSSCASGSGYVPSCSIGFCVASTKNGSGRTWRWPPAVTCRSCIASSKRGLGFGRCPVDLVGQDQVGEDRTRNEPQLARAAVPILVEHLGAGDVAGHQVGRELDPVEFQRERLRQRVHHQGLGEAGHAFENAVAAGEDGDQELIDDLVLPDDLPADLLADLVVGRSKLFKLGEVELVFGRWCSRSRPSVLIVGKPEDT